MTESKIVILWNQEKQYLLILTKFCVYGSTFLYYTAQLLIEVM